jgi:hypothetical protein
MTKLKLKLNELEPVTLEDIRREAEDTREYNGHKNWNHWNVSLWLDNDESIYKHIQDIISRHLAGQVRYTTLTKCCRIVQNSLPKNTPDGARYSLFAIEAHMTREIQEVKQFRKTQKCS